MNFKVIVAGGRDFNDYDLLEYKLDRILSNKNNIEIVSGKARGADENGEKYAIKKGYTLTQFKAEWEKYGKRAGYIRNEEMAKYANACVCFWDGKSKGTKHMIDLANKYNLPLRIIRY